MTLDNFELCSENTNEEIFFGFNLLGLNLFAFIILLQLLPGKESYFIIFFALQLLIYSVLKLQKFHSLATWPSIKMTVLHTEIVIKKIHSELGMSECFQPIVEYQYEVDGCQYQSKNIIFDIKSITFPEKEEIKILFSMIQKECIAYVNPSKPQESVLFKNLHKKRKSHFYTLALIGTILLGLGIWIQTY